MLNASHKSAGAVCPTTNYSRKLLAPPSHTAPRVAVCGGRRDGEVIVGGSPSPRPMCDSMNIFRRRGGPNPTKGKTMSYSDPLAPRTSLSEEVDGLGTRLANLDFEYVPRDEM